MEYAGSLGTPITSEFRIAERQIKIKIFTENFKFSQNFN